MKYRNENYHPYTVTLKCKNGYATNVTNMCMECYTDRYNGHQVLNGYCPRCYYYSRSETICSRCKNIKPRSSQEFIRDFKLACNTLIYYPKIIVTDRLFASGYRGVDYIKHNMIGRIVSWNCDFEPQNKHARKITSIRGWSDGIIITTIQSDGNAYNTSYGSSSASVAKEYYILDPIITWKQLRLIFIAYHKDPTSPFAQLSYEILHYIIQYLIL